MFINYVHQGFRRSFWTLQHSHYHEHVYNSVCALELETEKFTEERYNYC